MSNLGTFQPELIFGVPLSSLFAGNWRRRSLACVIPSCEVSGDSALKNCSRRDAIGSSTVLDDKRWAGAYGIDADFVAKSHCSVEFIPTEAINVMSVHGELHARVLFRP